MKQAVRPPDELLCELVFREIKNNEPIERVIFVSTDVTIKSVHYPEFDSVLLQHERQYWVEDKTLLAVIYVAVEGYAGERHSVVDYLPDHTTYTARIAPRLPEWDRELDETAIKTAHQLFEEGDD
jgi:hypothetical protein